MLPDVISQLQVLVQRIWRFAAGCHRSEEGGCQAQTRLWQPCPAYLRAAPIQQLQAMLYRTALQGDVHILVCSYKSGCSKVSMAQSAAAGATRDTCSACSQRNHSQLQALPWSAGAECSQSMPSAQRSDNPSSMKAAVAACSRHGPQLEQPGCTERPQHWPLPRTA